MRIRSLFLAARIAPIVLATLAAPAGAQTPAGSTTPPTAPAPIRQDVRELHNNALKAFLANDFQHAYEGFSKAWALQPLPRIAGNLGRAELKLSKYRDAAEHLAFFLRTSTDLSDDDRKLFTGLLEQAKINVATIRVEATPANAEVRVDNTQVGTIPLDHELFLEPGSHTIEVRSGDATALQEIVTRAGANEVLKLAATASKSLPPSASSPSTAPTTRADDGPTGIASSTPFPTRTVLLVSGTGATLLALGAGATLAGLSGAKGSAQPLFQHAGFTASEERRWSELEKDRVLMANAAIGAGIASGVLGAGTLAVLLTGFGKPRSSKSQAAGLFGPLHVAPTGTGLMITGTW